MGIWTPRAKPEESKFTYTPTTRCITNLNYVLMMQGHWDCATHRVAEKDHHGKASGWRRRVFRVARDKLPRNSKEECFSSMFFSVPDCGSQYQGLIERGFACRHVDCLTHCAQRQGSKVHVQITRRSKQRQLICWQNHMYPAMKIALWTWFLHVILSLEIIPWFGIYTMIR